MAGTFEPRCAGHSRSMKRALMTLIGLAGAAALLLLVNDTGSSEGGDLWQRAALIAAAGLVAGVFAQVGGIGRPGVHANVPLLIFAFAPWTVLALAVTAHRAGTPVALSDLASDLVPGGAFARWSSSFPILVFVDGLLLGLALIEPRVRVRAVEAAPLTETVAPTETLTATEPREPAEVG